MRVVSGNNPFSFQFSSFYGGHKYSYGKGKPQTVVPFKREKTLTENQVKLEILKVRFPCLKVAFIRAALTLTEQDYNKACSLLHQKQRELSAKNKLKRLHRRQRLDVLQELDEVQRRTADLEGSQPLELVIDKECGVANTAAHYEDVYAFNEYDQLVPLQQYDQDKNKDIRLLITRNMDNNYQSTILD